METFPATNEEQFAFIKKQIDTSDYYVLIIAARYGTLTDEEISFTEKEFNYAVENKIPVLVFPIEDPTSVAVSKTDQDTKKTEKLQQFRQRAMRGRNAFKWTTADNLCLGIVQALQNARDSFPRTGWVRGDIASAEGLLNENRQLRLENDKLKKASEEKATAAKNNSAAIDMNREIEVRYDLATKGGKKKTSTVKVQLRDIVSQFQVTEPVDEPTIRDCVRGAVSLNLDSNFEDTNVDQDAVDKALLLLVSFSILHTNSSFDGLNIRHGSNWLNAIAQVKFEKR